MKKLGELVYKKLIFPFFIFKGGKKIIEELYLYRMDEKYARYIYNEDKKVLKAFDQKDKRPFIGIILKINNINYFAPLSSPKKKHQTMKNNVDFIKINNGRDGVINLNNMIPIPLEDCKKINLKEEIMCNKKYGLILKYQILWCNKNKNKIINNAEKLYNLIVDNRANIRLKQRCCNFKKLENKLNQFLLNQRESE